MYCQHLAVSSRSRGVEYVEVQRFSDCGGFLLLTEGLQGANSLQTQMAAAKCVLHVRY